MFVFVFVFGTIIGSFLNVVVLRYGTGRSITGRSKCAVTGKTLRWFELIPIISFIAQGGRTRHGGAKISIQYPLVEFFTGIGFVAIFSHFLRLLYIRPESFILNIFFYFTVFSFLVLIFVYDYRHKIIPDDFVYPLMVLSVIPLFYEGLPLIRFLSGPIAAFPVFVLWWATSGRGMGFGDVKLLLPIGWLLGVSSAIASLLIAFWIGAIFGLVMIAFSHKKMRSEIPFGPFIIFGAVIVFLYNIDMNSIAAFFGRLI
jgi:prepilin signal peptidase PulO-like enzyme (type II secretory pathway)